MYVIYLKIISALSKAGVIHIPKVSGSIEEGFSEDEYSAQQAFLRKHDKKTKRLDFLWDENAKDSIQKTSIKDHWGCDWFQPDEHSRGFTFWFLNTVDVSFCWQIRPMSPFEKATHEATREILAFQKSNIRDHWTAAPIIS